MPMDHQWYMIVWAMVIGDDICCKDERMVKVQWKDTKIRKDEKAAKDKERWKWQKDTKIRKGCHPIPQLTMPPSSQSWASSSGFSCHSGVTISAMLSHHNLRLKSLESYNLPLHNCSPSSSSCPPPKMLLCQFQFNSFSTKKMCMKLWQLGFWKALCSTCMKNIPF